jgi:hypothetical protein
MTAGGAEEFAAHILGDVRDALGPRWGKNPAVSTEIAERLAKLRRRGEEPDNPNEPPHIEPNPIWSPFTPQAAADAANLLHRCLPLMLDHWREMLPTRKTRLGVVAIEALRRPLRRALPFINRPLGKTGRSTHKRSRDWHIPAWIIAMDICTVIAASGKVPPRIKGPALGRITSELLEKKGYRVEAAAVAMHLKRRAAEYGWPFT